MMNIDKNYIGVHLNRPLNFNEVSDGIGYVHKVAVQIAETTDRLVLSAIEEIAKEQGITDLYVIDKRNVVAALKKQIPMELDYEGDGYDENGLIYDYAKCRVCGHDFEYGINDWGCKYCSDCGQALDWGQED